MKNAKPSIVIGTNIWSLHMVPLAREIAAIVGGDDFRMILFEQMHEERLRMGWEDNNNNRPAWLAGPPQNESDYQNLLQLCLNADVAVLGTVSREVVNKRAATGKLTFIISERILKKPWHHFRMINPRYARGIILYRRMVNQPNMHALAIGHFAPSDLKTIGAFGNRIWNMGYFVELNAEQPKPLKSRPLHILWVGRMLDLKRIDLLVRAVSMIQNQSWFSHCLIVGDGPDRNRIESLANRLKIGNDKLEFRPPVPMEAVRSLMREHDVYVLTSNRHEGWGAVAGEAISEGCVLVANEQAGASRTLISHGETGFLFANGDVNGLVDILSQIGRAPHLQERIRQAAWRNMQDTWSPRVGAERLINLIQDLHTSGVSNRYPSGPCSRYFG